MSDKNTYRRQVRTTLNPEHEKMLDAICEERGKREPEIVREALVKFLRSAISEAVIREQVEAC